MGVINSAALDLTTVVCVRVCVCARLCVCVCACMCMMSFITQVQLACRRVPGTVQCLGTKRADETAFCRQSGELGHLWSCIPEGRRCVSPNTPRSPAHGHTHCLNTHDDVESQVQSAAVYVCIYVNVFVWGGALWNSVICIVTQGLSVITVWTSYRRQPADVRMYIYAQVVVFNTSVTKTLFCRK